MSARRSDSGLTLVEVLVSLSLFALIGVAGFGIVEAILNVRERTDGRLERIGEIQRAMRLLRLDFEQASGDGLAVENGVVALTRFDPEPIKISYFVAQNGLRRRVRMGERESLQRALSGVASAKWRFFQRRAGWREDWPPPGDKPPRFPDAVELVLFPLLGADPPSGELRQVIRMTGEASHEE